MNGEVIGESSETTTQTSPAVQPQSQMVPNPSHGPTTTGSPVTTGTGLTDVVPVENLQSVGAGPAAPKITQGPTQQTQPSPSVVPPGPATRNIEHYPSYDLGDNNVYIIGQNGQPQPVIPGGGRKSSVMRTGVSTKSMLNSYYKQQLLGLLYKVG